MELQIMKISWIPAFVLSLTSSMLSAHMPPQGNRFEQPSQILPLSNAATFPVNPVVFVPQTVYIPIQVPLPSTNSAVYPGNPVVSDNPLLPEETRRGNNPEQTAEKRKNPLPNSRDKNPNSKKRKTQKSSPTLKLEKNRGRYQFG